MKRLAHFWYYHKWYVLGALFLAVAAIAIYLAAAQTDQSALNVVITDHYGDDIDTALLTERYTEAAEHPRSISYDVTMALDTSTQLQITLVNEQKLTAMNSAGHLDVFLAPESVFETYTARGLFLSLDSLLPAETVDVLLMEGKLVVAGLDPNVHPEGITERADGLVCSGVHIVGSKLAAEAGINVKDLCVGIPVSSTRRENALVFLQLFLDG